MLQQHVIGLRQAGAGRRSSARQRGYCVSYRHRAVMLSALKTITGWPQDYLVNRCMEDADPMPQGRQDMGGFV